MTAATGPGAPHGTGRTGKLLADRCLEVLAGLGGEASSPAIRKQLWSQGTRPSQAYLSGVLNALARRLDPPVTRLGSAEVTPGRTQSRAVGRNARALRVSAGVTQKDAAAAAGVSQSTLSLYERGPMLIPAAVARALAQVLGTTVEALAADSGAVA